MTLCTSPPLPESAHQEPRCLDPARSAVPPVVPPVVPLAGPQPGAIDREAQVRLGVALLHSGRLDAAKRALRAALAIDPCDALACGTLAQVLLRQGRPVAAEAACRQAVALDPGQPDWIATLAEALHAQARLAEAERCARKVLALRPDSAADHSALLRIMLDRDDLADSALAAEYRQWADRFGRQAGGTAEPPPRPVGAPLRIGYLVPGCRRQTLVRLCEPLFAAHDRRRVALYLYAELPPEDAAAACLRAVADHWRSSLGLDDAALAAAIRRDGIDVLVDLGGHAPNSRTTVLASRPAPVQLAWPFGEGDVAAGGAVDATLTDPVMLPPGVTAAGPVIRLPRIPMLYQPPTPAMPVGPLPALGNPFTTFGYFGPPARLNPDVIATWAAILRAVPQSRLVLNDRGFNEPAFGDGFADRFAACGIERERIDMTYTAPRPCTWVAYGAIDIALDPFPHNAGPAAIEALWHGVPVLALAGRCGPGRFTASVLHAAGLADWVTADPAAYAARAIAAAADLVGLAALRGGLRGRLAASAVCDAAGLARCLEAVFAACRAPAGMPDPIPIDPAACRPPPANPLFI
jgi:predicted O-linked N-acetylglucosamine transferase (SPINDLY family)